MTMGKVAVSVMYIGLFYFLTSGYWWGKFEFFVKKKGGGW